MKMSGYNGSQLWDTAFTVQAYIAADLDTTPCIESLKKAHMYIRNTQVSTPQTAAFHQDTSSVLRRDPLT